MTPDFICGHHRGHGICKNKAKKVEVPCDDEECQACHDACMEDVDDTHYQDSTDEWKSVCLQKKRPSGCTCDWIVDHNHGYVSLMTMKCQGKDIDLIQKVRRRSTRAALRDGLKLNSFYIC